MRLPRGLDWIPRATGATEGLVAGGWRSVPCFRTIQLAGCGGCGGCGGGTRWRQGDLRRTCCGQSAGRGRGMESRWVGTLAGGELQCMRQGRRRLKVLSQ